jgi:uncharacterized membrane protein
MIKLLPLLLFSVGLSLGRCWYTDSPEYLFMNWNLFLAILPFAISSFLEAYESLYPRALLILCLAVWLLFFPNGPYLITDIIHLRDHRKGPMIWFDLILFFSYAYLGLLLAMDSAKQIEKVLARYLHWVVAKISMSLIFFAVSFGVYLGRFLRFNSWDLFYKPLDIFADVSDCFSKPADHGNAYAMTLLFGLMLNVVYFAFTKSYKTLHAREDSNS